MTFEEWLEYGRASGFCSEVRCDTHDLVEATAEEKARLEAGADPCIPTVRLYPLT